MGGKIVRLREGRASQSTVYSADPAALAQSWSKTGIGGIHVVDLDGAFSRGNNFSAIQQIIQAAETPVQVGGGIRTPAIAQRLVEAEADALVIGTVALTDEIMFNRIVEIVTLPKIVIALDYRGENVLTKGWQYQLGLKLDGALSQLLKMGVRDFLLTSAERDGMMDGPDVGTIRRICSKHREARIFASGGSRSVTDIASLRDAGAHAVIVGRAFLEGSLSISDAVRTGAG